MAPEFTTKDSGERSQYDSGMQRDTEAGKPRFDLMIPEGVAYEDQMLTRFAALLDRGAQKYNARNWEKANSGAEIARAKSSAFRHFIQWFTGETDEDHAAAVMFNLMVVETTRLKIEVEEEPDDFEGVSLNPYFQAVRREIAGIAAVAGVPSHTFKELVENGTIHRGGNRNEVGVEDLGGIYL